MNIALRIVLHALQVICLIIAVFGGVSMLVFATGGEQMVAEDVLISNTFIIFAVLALVFSPSKWTLKRQNVGTGADKAPQPQPGQVRPGAPNGAPAPQAQQAPYPPQGGVGRY
ncbi:hypothetical protein [Nocardiopsis baichengensis]|uniref:hypothetical protein n=1 Tax=Nocardiopsis baichengensis TaxID=280240 RepID=UPI00034C73DD|nr:hypothetical protein [Nocardiopsis baichengensis]